MSRFTCILGATIIFAISTLALAGNDAPKFPGLGELWNNTSANKQEILEQREHRARVEEFARELKKWWYAENEPAPKPNMRFKGKMVKIPGKFLKAYLKAKEENKLGIAWDTIEQDTQVIQATVICCG